MVLSLKSHCSHTVLHKSNFDVIGFDVWQPAMDLFSRGGGKVAKDLKSVADQAEILILVVVSAAQAEDILIDQGIVKGTFSESTSLETEAHSIHPVLSGLATDAVVIIMSTVAPSAAVALSAKIQTLRPDVHYLDAPISGGAVRAGKGDLTIPVAGENIAIRKALPVLKAMSGTLGNHSNLIIIPGGVGKAAVVKLVNQVLAGKRAVQCGNSTLNHRAVCCHRYARLDHRRSSGIPGSSGRHSRCFP